MKIEARHLMVAGIPPWEIAKFTAEWPAGVEITAESVARSHEIGLNPEPFVAVIAPSVYAKRPKDYFDSSETRKRHELELAEEKRAWEAQKSQLLADWINIAMEHAFPHEARSHVTKEMAPA